MNRWMSPLPAGRAIALGTVALALGLALGSFRVRALETEIEPGATKAVGGGSSPQEGGDSAKAAGPAARQEGTPSANGIYHVEPFHVLQISVLVNRDTCLISGNHLVEPDGKVDLGPLYGKFMVSALTLEEAEDAARNFIKKLGINRPEVSVSLAGWVPRWLHDPRMKAPYHIEPLNLLKIRLERAERLHPLGGDFLIEPSGKINLGPVYGRVALAGLTLEEAQEAIEKHLKKLGFADSRASVTLGGWQNDWHDLMKQGIQQTGQAPPKPGSRESLSYGSKTFAEWRAVLTTELKPEVRIEAIKALSAFGANGYGKEAAEAIIEVMRGYDVAGGEDVQLIGAAYPAFRKIGSEGVPALVDELKHGKINGRRFAILALPFTGTDGTKAAAPAILEAFKDEDSYVRRHAISNVNTHDVDPKPLVLALTEALKHADPNMRLSAALKMQQMGEKARPAIPALIAAFTDDKDVSVRNNALWALQKIGPRVKEVVPALIMALKDKDQSFRLSVLECLLALGPEAKEAVPALIVGFNEYPTDRAEIARVLGSIGPAAKEALPTLIEFMQQPQLQPQLGAVQEALRKIIK